MAKKTQVEILVHTPFTFTDITGEKTSFAAGRHNVEKDVAEHWFVAAHADQTGNALATGDDTALLTAEIDTLKAQLEEKVKLIGEQTEQIVEKDNALALLTAEIDSLKAAGAGANVKK
ncbi:STY1053 family phage-associated protein [Erwinia rhapontici]|uniref:STY1053 family phage-associated protein n=1 Tax=Erwinia rhapontici TaxID=55212 RepID=UPI00105E0B66|nr:hypothetical protein [Erwinia rhapontici]TDT01679.1 hypothetical protein EDF84_101406 [Erwinia rhapontici]